MSTAINALSDRHAELKPQDGPQNVKAGTTRPDCLKLDIGFNHLRKTYETLALISKRAHLNLVTTPLESTLLVSCDWLLWQQLSDEGYHVVYIEQGHQHAAPTKTLSQDILIFANSWCEIDGEDVTIFNGVSLGMAYSTQISFFLAAYHRLCSAMDVIIDRFSPTQLVYIDLRMHETALMTASESAICVEAIARSNDLKLIDAFDWGDENTDPDRRPVSYPLYRWLRTKAVRMFEVGISGISRLLKNANGSTNVPLIVQGMNLFGALAGHKPAGSQAMIAPGILPKSLRTTGRYLKNGFLFPSLPKAILSPSEVTDIDAMVNKLQAAWASPADHRTAALREYVKTRILGSGKLYATAADIKRIQIMLQQWRPSRIIVDGIKNMPNYGYIACATALNIPTDYIWHAPLAPEELRFKNLGCDDGKVMINRIMSWGPINDQWLANMRTASIPCHRIGVPYFIKYKRTPGRALPPSSTKRALLCQYTVLIRDLASPMSLSYEHFIRTVRALNEKGYEEIIFKLHPGYSGAMTIFTAIAQYFGLNCRILRFEPFDELVRSCDVAVGHLFSGSALDIVASETPFLAAMMEPTDLNFSYYEGCENIARSVDELVTFIETDAFLDAEKYLSQCFYNVSPETCAENYWQAILS